SATPPSEVLAEQGSSSPQYERTVSRQVGAGSSTLRADQEPGGPGRNQHVAGTPDPPVRGTAVESPSLYDALEVQVAPDREPLAADPHAGPRGDARPLCLGVVAVIAPEFLRRERVHQGRDDR